MSIETLKSNEAQVSNTGIEAQGMYSLLTDRGTNVIARRANGKPLFAISGGCGTVILTDKNARQGYVLSETVIISDVHGIDPSKNYPKRSIVPNGSERTETLVEWFNEGDKVAPGLIHDHNGPLTAETPRGGKVNVRKFSEDS